MNISEFIPVGKDNAISRSQLVKLTGLSDRIVRDMIALERRNTAILNLQNGAGYYIPSESDKSEIERFETSSTVTDFDFLKVILHFAV